REDHQLRGDLSPPDTSRALFDTSSALMRYQTAHGFPGLAQSKNPSPRSNLGEGFFCGCGGKI
ncbi:hypothetical protein, partial [Kocuria sp.]|uniref:hypothetical protein n=1 Tax=Kocuria sp. TaxID=1871328 RepID=UPI0026DF3BB3